MIGTRAECTPEEVENDELVSASLSPIIFTECALEYCSISSQRFSIALILFTIVDSNFCSREANLFSIFFSISPTVVVSVVMAVCRAVKSCLAGAMLKYRLVDVQVGRKRLN